jgi:hypothetical protein
MVSSFGRWTLAHRRPQKRAPRQVRFAPSQTPAVRSIQQANDRSEEAPPKARASCSSPLSRWLRLPDSHGQAAGVVLVMVLLDEAHALPLVFEGVAEVLPAAVLALLLASRR